MEIPFGYVLIGISVGSLIWGISCAVIGSILRFNAASWVNAYISQDDTTDYQELSNNMLTVPTKLETVDLGNSAFMIGVLTIIIGILVIVYSLIGIIGGIMKNISMMFLLIGCILVSTMLQFVVIWMLIDSDSGFHESAKDELASTLATQYQLGENPNDFTLAMNALMVNGKCCGIHSPDDFANLTWVPTEGNKPAMSLSVSPACCKKTVWSRLNGEGIEPLIDCAKLTDVNDVYQEGCYKTLFNDAYDSSMGTYVILLFVIIIWQCVGMAIAVLILFQPKDEDKLETGPTMTEEAPMEDKKPFTPFSKLSSFQSSEVNRMRSTEIW